jgi:hypothetical protein
MAHFLASNWIWILLAGAGLYLYFGRRHGGHMAGMGGCSGGHWGHQSEPDRHDEQVHPGEPHGQHPDHDPLPDDRSASATPARRHGGC